MNDRPADIDAMASLLAEKDAVIRELHHRSRNVLQLILSLIDLQSRRGEADGSGGDALGSLRRRIGTILLVHSGIDRPRDLHRVDFAAILRELVEEGRGWLGEREGADIRLILDLAAREEGWLFPLPVAQPAAVIVAELLSNAVEHAFPSGWSAAGEVHVELAGQEGEVLLRVRDDGIGWPRPSAAEEGLGWRLVNGLVRQLRGTVERRIGEVGGTSVEIRFPDGSLEPAP